MTYLKNSLHALWRLVYHFLPQWPESRWGKRVAVIFIAVLVLMVAGMYGVARWYVSSVDYQKQVVGASFVPSYAEYLGVDAQETLDAMLNDLDIKHLRLVGYWNEIEPEQGNYDFSQLDWQFDMADKAGAEVTLSLGLRQPRWPECHPPTWVDTSRPREQWQPYLLDFIGAVVERYKDRPSLQNYQLENEYFLKAFGECQNFDRDRLIAEYKFLKKVDPDHPIIITRSNNGLGIPLYAPTPDIYGVSVYKRVWDSGGTRRYLEYPQPSWYYAFMAGVQKLVQGRDMNIHELQAEAWAPRGRSLKDISLEEQNKSLDAERLAERFVYGRDTGLRTIDMWGAEYWYYRWKVLNDPSLWEAAKTGYAAN